ncbi:hypothetical protein [Flagellimonas myxillae]|uniref:hypothetical protein n=1 Tax=Flagellimonas myxillae TaxID=2942214 RepID=UPI00201F11B6|nr:hypothetical protein [Muricauda myxillae]MCL6265351.1 hypothetical protein [Muricauda myxillae]
MNDELIKSHYSTVYITLSSILLGVALADLVSIFRTIENPDYFHWLSLILIVLLIMNAWISYSLHAISVKLIPIPADAVNVFAISIAHFTLNSFIIKPHYQFYFAICFYSLVTTLTMLFTFYRASQFDSKVFFFRSYRRVIVINIAGLFLSAFFGWLSLNGHLSKVLEFATFAIAYLCILVWLMMYWKVWKSQLNK